MTKHEYKQNAYYMIYLIRCMLHGRQPSADRLGKMDLAGIYYAAKQHSLLSVTSLALKHAGVRSEEFVDAENNAVYRGAILEYEYREIAEELDRRGIWYLPVKGAVMKRYYPKPEMREMSDYDILCDEERIDEVCSVMRERGFTKQDSDDRYQYRYFKEPVFVFEMHSRLFEPRHRQELYRYYNEIKSRLIKNGEGAGYHFSDEDFYVFMTAHGSKHFDGAGIGLRSLLDIYVFLTRFEGRLDRMIIDCELKRLGLDEFESRSRSLAFKLFGGCGGLTDEESRLLDYYIFSNTHGTISNRVTNGLRKNASLPEKLAYAYKRSGFSEETMKEFYPFFYKHKAFRPLLVLSKLIRKTINDRRKMMTELKQLVKY